jgi:hypothetical protein
MSKQNELAQLADVVTVDGSNVGIGVVPKTWNVYDQAVQIGDGAAIWTYQNAEAHYSVNSYYNSGNKYIGTGTALQYQQAAGAHSFKTATSGTANAAISWNTKVNIDSDGLKFNGDTAAANALDDYEEGTFTLTLNGVSGGAFGVGLYVKVGGLVHFQWYSNGAITVSSSTGGFVGLPFTTASGAYYATFSSSHNTYTPNASGGYLNTGTNSGVFTNNGTVSSAPTSAGSGRYLMVAGTYKTNS